MDKSTYEGVIDAIKALAEEENMTPSEWELTFFRRRPPKRADRLNLTIRSASERPATAERTT
jgi:hypothetical protein